MSERAQGVRVDLADDELHMLVLGLTDWGVKEAATERLAAAMGFRLLRQHGATFQQEFNFETTLVELGDLRPHQLQDDREGGVDAIDQVALSRQRRAPHVHLVHQDDVEALLQGEPVPCRRVPRGWAEMKKQSRRPTARRRPYA